MNNLNFVCCDGRLPLTPISFISENVIIELKQYIYFINLFQKIHIKIEIYAFFNDLYFIYTINYFILIKHLSYRY